jgi:hypothetical protein
MAGTGRLGRRRKQLMDEGKERKGKEKILEIEGGSTVAHCLVNSPWKRL